MEIVALGFMAIIIWQLARLEVLLKDVCKNQVETAKLIGRAHNIPVKEVTRDGFA